MDGGRRLLESMMGAITSILPARFGRSDDARAAQPQKLVRRAPLRRRLPRRTLSAQLTHLVTRRGFGTALAFLVVGTTASYGFVRGGHYDTFVAEAGRPADMFARALGFGVSLVAISGQRELTNSEVLEASGVTTRDSILFLDVQAVRQRLKSLPLVRDATVRKLYPDQLVIAVTERTPYALWQLDGEVSVIAADGTVIDQMRDQRFTKLPFVVGEGANERVPEFLKLLEAAGDLKSRVSAGVLVGQRRWNFKLNNGVDVRLPESDPEAAVAKLAVLARDNKLPDKDVIAIDMRMPGRITVRLSEDAAAQRLEARSKKARPKGGAA